MALCADILVQSGRRVAFLPLGGDEDMAVAPAVNLFDACFRRDYRPGQFK
jgi:hypothetical protein